MRSASQATLQQFSPTPENANPQLSDFYIEKVPHSVARPFMEKYHYSGGLGNAAMCWGCYDGATGELMSVIGFQTPISENTRDSVFGPHVCGCQLVDPRECNREECEVRGEHHHLAQHVTELHRLASVPHAPKNTGSWIISRAITALKEYKPKYWAVVSMADSTEGHEGIQYQAANADYYGMTGRAMVYIDNDGRLRHPRQCGENITVEEAKERGWDVEYRAEKHRYVFWLPYRSMRSVEGLREFSNLDLQPYPDMDDDAESYDERIKRLIEKHRETLELLGE